MIYPTVWPNDCVPALAPADEPDCEPPPSPGYPP